MTAVCRARTSAVGRGPVADGCGRGDTGRAGRTFAPVPALPPASPAGVRGGDAVPDPPCEAAASRCPAAAGPAPPPLDAPPSATAPAGSAVAAEALAGVAPAELAAAPAGVAAPPAVAAAGCCSFFSPASESAVAG